MLNPLNLVLLLSLFDPEVSLLATQLGDDEWLVREKASAALVKMDERPIKVLRLLQVCDDAEVRHRANRIVRAYEGSLFPTKYGKMPWIDHLPSDFPDRDKIVSKYIDPYREYHQYDGEGDYKIFRDATADFILEYSKKGHSRKECVELLDKMAGSEESWIFINTTGGKNFYKALPEK